MPNEVQMEVKSQLVEQEAANKEVASKADLSGLRYLPIATIEAMVDRVYKDDKENIDLYFALKNAIVNNKLVDANE